MKNSTNLNSSGHPADAGWERLCLAVAAQDAGQPTATTPPPEVRARALAAWQSSLARISTSPRKPRQSPALAPKSGQGIAMACVLFVGGFVACGLVASFTLLR